MKHFRLSCLLLLFTVMLPSGTSIIYAGNMGDFATDVEISATALHEWMPSVTYNPAENEFLVLWHV